jgi:predicted DNA-binding transcriptional regulator AlpA
MSAESQRSATLPSSGFVRLKQILGPLGPIPISKSTWWAGVAAGRFPKPVKISRNISAWRVEDIRALLRAFRGTIMPGSRKHPWWLVRSQRSYTPIEVTELLGIKKGTVWGWFGVANSPPSARGTVLI